MKFFPIVVISLLGIVTAMWANLDALKERFGVAVGVCESPYKVQWIPWEAGLVEAKRAEGEMVWLTFSADWDLSSKVNEKRVFSNEEVIGKLTEHRVVLVKADLTQLEPEIEKELQSYGRVSVPTDLVFPADLEAELIFLPEIILPDVAVEAIEKAATLSVGGM